MSGLTAAPEDLWCLSRPWQPVSLLLLLSKSRAQSAAQSMSKRSQPITLQGSHFQVLLCRPDSGVPPVRLQPVLLPCAAHGRSDKTLTGSLQALRITQQPHRAV